MLRSRLSFAIAIAFVTDPLIRLGERRLGLPRWVVSALIYAVLVLLFFAVTLVKGPAVLNRPL